MGDHGRKKEKEKGGGGVGPVCKGIFLNHAQEAFMRLPLLLCECKVTQQLELEKIVRDQPLAYR
jgi:hypothetical protein